jgi:apolipoprotein N-acyltransferase
VRSLRRFALFWYDFIVGDDWRIAVGVILALGATGALAHHGYDVWWLMPIAVIGLLAYSIARIARS